MCTYMCMTVAQQMTNLNFANNILGALLMLTKVSLYTVGDLLLIKLGLKYTGADLGFVEGGFSCVSMCCSSKILEATPTFINHAHFYMQLMH